MRSVVPGTTAAFSRFLTPGAGIRFVGTVTLHAPGSILCFHKRDAARPAAFPELVFAGIAGFRCVCGNRPLDHSHPLESEMAGGDQDRYQRADRRDRSCSAGHAGCCCSGTNRNAGSRRTPGRRQERLRVRTVTSSRDFRKRSASRQGGASCVRQEGTAVCELSPAGMARLVPGQLVMSADEHADCRKVARVVSIAPTHAIGLPAIRNWPRRCARPVPFSGC